MIAKKASSSTLCFQRREKREKNLRNINSNSIDRARLLDVTSRFDDSWHPTTKICILSSQNWSPVTVAVNVQSLQTVDISKIYPQQNGSYHCFPTLGLLKWSEKNLLFSRKKNSDFLRKYPGECINIHEIISTNSQYVFSRESDSRIANVYQAYWENFFAPFLYWCILHPY